MKKLTEEARAKRINNAQRKALSEELDIVFKNRTIEIAELRAINTKSVVEKVKKELGFKAITKKIKLLDAEKKMLIAKLKDNGLNESGECYYHSYDYVNNRRVSIMIDCKLKTSLDNMESKEIPALNRSKTLETAKKAIWLAGTIGEAYDIVNEKN